MGERRETLCGQCARSRPSLRRSPVLEHGVSLGSAMTKLYPSGSTRAVGTFVGLCAPLRAVRCRSVRQRAASVRTSTSGKCRYNRRLAIGLERARFRVRVLIELSDDEAVAAAVMLPMVAADRLAPNASSHTGGAFKRNARGVI